MNEICEHNEFFLFFSAVNELIVLTEQSNDNDDVVCCIKNDQSKAKNHVDYYRYMWIATEEK